LNYEPLIERDLDAIPSAAHDFLESHPVEELWVAVTRFAVLAYSPSQHGKRAVMACRAAYELRDALGDRWTETIIECARYAAEARQPWSEPPVLDPPESSSGDSEELRAAMREGDRARGERWLAARLDDAEDALREVARGDALLMLDTAIALEEPLGEKGRYALLRMPLWELIAEPDAASEDASLQTLVARAEAEKGAVDAVRAVFVRAAMRPRAEAGTTSEAGAPSEPYRLARDYAQTLIAHAVARTLEPSQAQRLVEAVHHNLEHGESFAEWSFA
jgi:hypothetical protein